MGAGDAKPETLRLVAPAVEYHAESRHRYVAALLGAPEPSPWPDGYVPQSTYWFARLDCEDDDAASRSVIEKSGGRLERREAGSLYFLVPTR